VSPPDAPDDVALNRAHWDAVSDEYQETNATQLNTKELAWGVCAIPEDELHVLGEVEGTHVLEFGCGAAQWSIFLARRGARPVGFDLSGQQLAHARRLMNRFGVTVPVVQASATAVPFRAEAFDVVFCDHGAMSFADPFLAVPEAARILRPDGLLAFSMIAPLFSVCLDPATDELDDRLHADYFGMHRFEWAEWGPPQVAYQLPYGEWIRLFRRNGLVIEDLIELRTPVGATSTYRTEAELEWGRRWPAEHIWKLRKERR
jgi:SAM-dependent methyltransferase